MRTVQMLATLALMTLLQGCAGDQITGPSPQPSPVRRPHSCVNTLDPKLGARGLRRDDIESLEVMKGAAAAARFGPAAEHGAILIRTRSGSAHTRTP